MRARIEHVFGAQENAPGGRLVRTIGIVRAKIKIGLQNLVYNFRRLVVLRANDGRVTGGACLQRAGRASGRGEATRKQRKARPRTDLMRCTAESAFHPSQMIELPTYMR